MCKISYEKPSLISVQVPNKQDFWRNIYMSDNSRAETLIGLCTKWFVERHEAIRSFWDSFSSIISALEEMEGWLDQEASRKAHLLHFHIEKSDKLIGLVCSNSFYSLMKPLAESIQQKDGDIVWAIKPISSIKTTLEEMQAHAETKLHSLYIEVKNMEKKIYVAMKVVQLHIALCSVYQMGVPNLKSGSTDPESHYRMAAFIPALDTILLDFSERYSSHFGHVATLSSLIPTIVHSKNWNDRKEGYEKYKDL